MDGHLKREGYPMKSTVGHMCTELLDGIHGTVNIISERAIEKC